MKLTADGLTMWYGTPDAPIPNEDGVGRDGASITIGVSPPAPANKVSVEYRVDGGAALTLPTWNVGTDYGRQAQYFRGTFPGMPSGHLVEYRATLRTIGRDLPRARDAGEFPSRFALVDRATPREATPANARHHGAPQFSQRLDFVANVKNKFIHQPEVIGETPEGIRVNYYLQGGHVVGPRLKGHILPRGGDFLMVRRDGVGAVSVRVTYKTDDGALIFGDYYGIVDLGVDGYEELARGTFPPLVSVQVAPRFLTADPRYAWMNRHQFVGFGQVRVERATVDYDLYTVHNDVCRDI